MPWEKIVSFGRINYQHFDLLVAKLGVLPKISHLPLIKYFVNKGLYTSNPSPFELSQKCAPKLASLAQKDLPHGHE